MADQLFLPNAKVKTQDQRSSWSHYRMLIAFAAVFLGIMSHPARADSRPGAEDNVRVVYHLDDASRAISAIRNIRNHRAAMPEAKITLVALGKGVGFMLEEAADDRGNPYEPMIDDLTLAGVNFKVCGNTLRALKIDHGAIHPEVEVVDSGVAEISRLQAHEGFVYIKP